MKLKIMRLDCYSSYSSLKLIENGPKDHYTNFLQQVRKIKLTNVSLIVRVTS